MDGENHGKPYVQMDDLGGNTPIFGNTHVSPTNGQNMLQCLQNSDGNLAPLLASQIVGLLLSSIINSMNMNINVGNKKTDVNHDTFESQLTTPHVLSKDHEPCLSN